LFLRRSIDLTIIATDGSKRVYSKEVVSLVIILLVLELRLPSSYSLAPASLSNRTISV
jgi:hypothetical protein